MDAIQAYIAENGQAPTRAELAALTGQRSTNGVNQILAALEKKGYIKLEPSRRRRNIVIVRLPVDQLSLLDGPSMSE